MKKSRLTEEQIIYEENRYLFESTKPQEVTELVAKGLRTLFRRT